MHVCIVGAGSLGSALGGALARGGITTSLVTRNTDHVAAIVRHGLRLVDDDGTVTVPVIAATGYDTMAPVDLAIVLVKSFDTRDAIVAARPALAPGATVLTLQNGVGCEEMIADVVGAEHVIAGRTFVGGRIIEPGVVEFGTAGRRTTIGELDGSLTDRIAGVAAMFESAGLAVDITTDIEAMAWEKLFVNVATGAWSALTGLPYGELSIDPDIEPMAIETVAEAMAVARALGIAVSNTDPARPWRAAWEGLPYGFKASMLQSIERGARTEVDVMHGAVCAGGRRAGVATPINDTLLAAVHGLERRVGAHRPVPH